MPEGITIIVISRADPPLEFARLVAGRRIARPEPTALSCTPEEAEAVLGGIALDPLARQRITRQSNGWLAALVLLREHRSRAGATLDESIGEGKDAIFQYFAGEIFNRAQPANRRVLMLTAIAPSVTPAEAVALSGNEDAAQLLEYLFRRHLFTDRRRGTARRPPTNAVPFLVASQFVAAAGVLVFACNVFTNVKPREAASARAQRL